MEVLGSAQEEYNIYATYFGYSILLINASSNELVLLWEFLATCNQINLYKYTSAGQKKLAVLLKWL